LLLCLPAHALDPARQMSQYVHDVWTTNEGLPQDSVNAIAQTPDGYLWIATQEGLARFDGAGFTTFDAAHGIADNFVYTLFVDRQGTLWLGASGGLLRYDGGGHFTRWLEADGWPATSARAIAEDRAGTLWVGMGNDGTSGAKGLVQFRDGVRAVLKTKDGLSSDVVSHTAFDRNGRAWIATSHGLDLMSGGKVVRTYTAADGLAGDVVRVVLVDREGAVWAGTDNGLCVLHDARFETVRGLSDNHILRLLQDRDGVLWIATMRGLNRLVAGRIETAPLPGLANDQIFALFEDREGSLWIGTHAGGLHRLRTAKFTAVGPPEGLVGESAAGIYEDRQGRIWIGTSPGGVNVLDRDRFVAAPRGITNGPRAFREDPDGAMWIGTREALHRLAGGKLETFTARDGLPESNVLVTARGRDGVVWIGTGRGVARYRNGRIAAVATPRGFPTSVRVIHEDRRGRLWFGGGEGLAWWDGAAFHVDARFAAAHIVSVSEDAGGTLWLGTWGQGLYRLRDDGVARFDVAGGLYDNVAWSILDDGRGNLWMGSNRGVYRVAKQQLDDYAARRLRAVTCTVYGTSDGMRRRETNWGSPAAIRTRDGRLWFGTTSGVAVIDPARIVQNGIPPPVVVQRFVADDRDFPGAGAPVLPPGTRNIEIDYAGLSLVSPAKVRYRYKLEGYDEQWIDAGTRRAAYYTHLAPGPYRFRVVAANDDGVWNESGASLPFRLKPYFHQTPWFYALVVVALVLTGFAINALRERHRRIRHQAFHDPLTGLPNRMFLDRRATEVLGMAQKQGRSFAILFLDLDGFKTINDTLGHASGDHLLQLVAARFRASLRGGDTLARIGGDEFAVLVETLDGSAAAADIAARLIDAVREPFSVDGHPCPVGVSIGIAIHPADGGDVKTILRAADRAMYVAKVAGGNAFRFSNLAGNRSKFAEDLS
jgi:diguanylate cyclase (GGDEF)-like protein